MIETCEIKNCEELSALRYLGRPICEKHFSEICAGIIDPDNPEVWKDEKVELNKETWEGSPSDLIRRYTDQWGLPKGF